MVKRNRKKQKIIRFFQLKNHPFFLIISTLISNCVPSEKRLFPRRYKIINGQRYSFFPYFSRIPEIYPILYFIVSLDIPTFIVMQQQHNISTLHNLIWQRVSIQSWRRKKCTRNSHQCANQTCKLGRFKQSHFDKLPVVIFQKKIPQKCQNSL